MTQMSISDFRQNLPSIVDRVLEGEEFEVLRNRRVVASFTLPKKKARKKIDLSAFGMWKDRKDWKGMSTIQIADMLREKAQNGVYDD